VKTVKIFKYFLFLILLLTTGKNIQAQLIDADTIMADTGNVNTGEIHSPRKAAMYSLILPGMGQAYNKKYWKIPLVYAGLGTIGYFAVWNNNQFNLMKTAYIDLKNYDDPTKTGTGYLKLKVSKDVDWDDQSLRAHLISVLPKAQAYYRRNRDLLIISIFGFYAINIIDANVDAHLFNFDIGDDLTMNWQPSMLKINNELAYCVSFSFNF